MKIEVTTLWFILNDATTTTTTTTSSVDKCHDSIATHQNLMKTLLKTRWTPKILDIMVDEDKTQAFI